MLVVFYRRRKSLGAGLITGIMNRVGDALILVSFFGLRALARSSASLASRLGVRRCSALLSVFLLARTTKSAQIPFSAWLPAAMAAPTPVSALVHSSTLVTAGVYLLLRFSPLGPGNSVIPILGTLGVSTILLARLRALAECDIKKIVALSTLRQLGVMFRAFNAGVTMLVFFHLVVHAFFKALLFICAGQIIHNIRDSQNLRGIGEGALACPARSATISLCKASLCGLPFYASFYSKEFILEGLATNRRRTLLSFFGIWGGVLLTAGYSIRFIKLVLLDAYRGSPLFHKQEKALPIVFAIFTLLPPSVISGKVISGFFNAQFMGSLERGSRKLLVVALLVLGRALGLAVGKAAPVSPS